jgi:hypothetical protein
MMTHIEADWMRLAAGTLLLAALAGCGSGPRPQAPREAMPPQGRSAEPRIPPPRPDPAAPAVRGKSFPECDPRAGDADRVRVGMGLLASDCADDDGRNAVYVTRFTTLLGAPSPAQRAGLRIGDRVVRIDACEVHSTHQVAMQLRSALPGWVARIYVERGGKTIDIFVPAVTLPGKAGAPAAPALSTAGCRSIGRKPAKS